MAKIYFEANGLKVDLDLPSKYLLDTVRKLVNVIDRVSEIIPSEAVGRIDFLLLKQPEN